MYWPLAADFFELTPLTAGQWCRVLLVSAAALVLTLASDRLLAPNREVRVRINSPIGS
jgi:hypothetical protein